MLVGIGQLRIDPGQEAVAENRRRGARRAADLLRRGARIALLPECANNGYFPRTREEALAISEPLDGPTARLWQDLARRYGGYVAGGILERSEEGLHNTALLVGPEGALGHYRKVHLFDWEREWLVPGDRLPVFRLPELGATVGLLVCYDLRFPEAVRAIADQGAELLLVPTAWTSIGKSVLWDRAGYCLQDHLAIGHAYWSRMAIACADRVGEEEDVRFLGASLLVQPGGEIAAGPLAHSRPASALADIDLSQARDLRVGSRSDLGRDRRPDVYRATLGGGDRTWQ